MPTPKEIMQRIGKKLEAAKPQVVKKNWREMSIDEIKAEIQEQNYRELGLRVDRFGNKTKDLSDWTGISTVPYIPSSLQPIKVVASETDFSQQHLVRLIKERKVAGIQAGSIYLTTVMNVALYIKKIEEQGAKTARGTKVTNRRHRP